MFKYIHDDFGYLFKKMRHQGFKSNLVIIPLILFTRDYWIFLKVLDIMVILASIFIFFILLPLMRKGKIKGYYPRTYNFAGDQLQIFFLLLNSAILRVFINYSVMIFNYMLIDSVTEANQKSIALRHLLEPLMAFDLILLSLIVFSGFIYYLFFHKKEILVSNYGKVNTQPRKSTIKSNRTTNINKRKNVSVENKQKKDKNIASSETSGVYRRYPKRD